MHNERYSILYSSATGNTRLLADTIRAALPPELCDAFGAVGETAAESELLYVGFWTDKGNADADTLALLRTLKNKRLFLFGTAGFGVDTAYFDAILARVQAVPDGSNTVIGTYMCQGKMPPLVRARYEAMRALPAPPENLDALIENFAARARTPMRTIATACGRRCCVCEPRGKRRERYVVRICPALGRVCGADVHSC